MIWGLKGELFGAFTVFFVIVGGIYLVHSAHYTMKSIIVAGAGVGITVFLYVINSFGCIIDIILKNIGETGWIPTKNIKHRGVIPGLNHRNIGFYIKVFEEGKTPKELKVYEELAPPWPEGVISQCKIYYLRTCKAVVGWEVEKEKINLSRKPRKSK